MKNRNAKGGGSVRQREDGTWEARCTINGKRRSFYADRQSDALKAMRTALAAADNGAFIEPSKMTVDQWMNTWLEEYIATTRKTSTYYTYRSKVETHIIPALGKIKLSSLNPTQVQTFYNDLKRKKKLSTKTIKDVHGILHKALKLAHKLKYAPINASVNCEINKVETKKIEPFTDEQIVAFFSRHRGA